MTGVIRMIKSDKRFGFIRADKDYFFHKDDVVNIGWYDLLEAVNHQDVKVEFTPKDTGKGPRASEVNVML